MTDAAAPAAPADAPQIRVCAGCGRTSPPLEPGRFATTNWCWRCYAQRRRGRLGLPPNPALDQLNAAYQRALIYRQSIADVLDRFTAVIRLAYSVGGLSTYDIADATGYQPAHRVGWSPMALSEQRRPRGEVGWSPMAIHSRLLPEQRRPRGEVGMGRTPTPEVIAEWAPQIKAANDAIDVAREQRAEAWQTFLELLRGTTATRRRHWNSLRVVGDALGVSHQQVQDWLHPPEESELSRCQGWRADGERCRAAARRGRRTCWRHADQEET